ncbi:MAG: 2Fe-2S iron-sulfur cluster binding domain-containing protein [Deltaproteobacteria bacterium]|nr:2Fe-2S iron-sulfur cluster binding domain-containing protein [Deltaproteobacteria bacterium]
MIRVRFEPAGFEVDAEPGEAIMDITDANPAAEVPYSCRAATCGTCRVRARSPRHVRRHPRQGAPLLPSETNRGPHGPSHPPGV